MIRVCLLVVALTLSGYVVAENHGDPGSVLKCQSPVPIEMGHWTPFDSLDSAQIKPLCFEPKPKGDEFILRMTVSFFSSFGTYEYRGTNRWVKIVVDDRTYEPPIVVEQSSRVRSAALLRALEKAGLRGLWIAADPDCDPEVDVISEGGSILEFYDRTGYFVRHGPRAQSSMCDTPYSRSYGKVMEVLRELHQIPPASRSRAGGR